MSKLAFGSICFILIAVLGATDYSNYLETSELRRAIKDRDDAIKELKATDAELIAADAELKQADARLKESDAQLKKAADHLSDVCWGKR